jgi:hypothetical protein
MMVSSVSRAACLYIRNCTTLRGGGDQMNRQNNVPPARVRLYGRLLSALDCGIETMRQLKRITSLAPLRPASSTSQCATAGSPPVPTIAPAIIPDGNPNERKLARLSTPTQRQADGENPPRTIFPKTGVTRQADPMRLWTGLISPTGSNT